MDVYGVGVLIMGESGIGKSEAALELIKRGHRLVTDDVVEIRKVSDDTLVGSAPDITRHFIELRGIGIVDVKSMFGVQSVRETQNIDLVITLEDWSREKEYDRLGLEETYTEFLGNKVVCHNIPIRPGRNLAIIVESAAVNHRQKQMGYNAAYFSFNKEGGRCEECKGEGKITVEMQFMADITLECEACHGKRFKQDVLDVEYQGANIYDVLEMTVISDRVLRERFRLPKRRRL